MNRLDNIDKFVSKVNEMENNELSQLLAEVEQSENAIKELAPRISEIIKTADKCVKSNKQLEKLVEKRSGDYWSHQLGFEYNYDVKGYVNRLVLRGGGCLGNWDIYVNDNGKITYTYDLAGEVMTKSKLETKNSYLAKIKESFDEFETDFYSTLDNLIG